MPDVQKLLLRALLSLIIAIAIMGAILFLSAGTTQYREAWWYLAAFALSSLLTTIDLMKRDPALLERRMHGGPQAEKERAQQVIMSIASLGFISLLVIPGLDHRFGWSTVPRHWAWVGLALLLLGFFFIDRVYRANSYSAATIRVEAGQSVVSTGPYGIVRHPMYASALLYIAGTPLALRSYWGFAGLAAMTPALIWRLIDEERLLAKELPGYREYMNRIRYRLIPGVW
jgi:protein-S-isoprenylcysteine O-methyltransferase Ste14